MAFGIAGALAAQQRMMDTLSAGMKWISAPLAYLDDIVVISKTFDEHLCHPESLLKRRHEGTLQLNPAKSTLCRRESAYLGFIVSAKGAKPNPTEIKLILAAPKGRKAVRQFSGIGSYYRRFMKNYARRAEPLPKLISQEVEFVWGREQQQAFEDIKQAITNATLTRHLDHTRSFIMDRGASTIGLGAALHQCDAHGKEYPVAFANRTLRPNKQALIITELEALAVVRALEAFRLEGSRTLVRSDQRPLFSRNNVGKSTRLARWVLRLQDTTFDLNHRPGAGNPVAILWQMRFREIR